jgi:isopentenyl diphosphate isomerase/L-lactate dehydrogenase-like FMN-dependent dehydrogenase
MNATVALTSPSRLGQAGIVHRAQDGGCSAIVLTVDSSGPRNNETLKRSMRVDNRTAIEHAADGIILSNHCGRNEEMHRATIDCLPEVIAAVVTACPYSLTVESAAAPMCSRPWLWGATAVGIGWPQVWGLAAFGQSGFEAVLDILNRELLAIMRQAGTTNLTAIRRELLVGSNPDDRM